MPRTVDHIVEIHQLARERVAAGKPVWAHKIDVSLYFHNDELSLEQKRDAIVTHIKASRWFKTADEDSELHSFVDELSDVDDVDWFNGMWDALYDLADYDRVWIKIR